MDRAARRKQEREREREEDNSGVFRRLVDESYNANKIANHLLRVTVRPGGSKRVLIVARDVERADALKRLLVQHEVGDSIAHAATIESALDAIRSRAPVLVVVEPDLADVCSSVLDAEVMVYVLNGDDVKTAEQIRRETS